MHSADSRGPDGEDRARTGVRPRLSIVIVSHEHGRFLGACLESVIAERRPEAREVIVVDNRSSDRSREIAGSFAGVQVLIPPRRQGFSANNNLGMAHARGEYLLLLNPDTRICPGALEAMVRFMDVHPGAGMCGARLVYPDGRDQSSARRFPTLASGLARRTPLGRLIDRRRFASSHYRGGLDRSVTQPTDWLLGACMFVRREAVRQVGPLDEGYFLYVEDIDWAKRMWRAGWSVHYVAEARIVHDYQAVIDRSALNPRAWTHARSMWRYGRKFLLPPLGRPRERFDVWAEQAPPDW